MAKAYLSLGSNERPEHYLQLAVNALRETFGNIIVSNWVQTKAVGFDGPEFIKIDMHFVQKIGRKGIRHQVLRMDCCDR